MADADRRFFAYADGSCLGNPGPGGWGVVILVILEATGMSAKFSGGEPSTTNNRMEITAAIEALRAIPPGAPITVRTDSQYVVNTMRLGWKRRQNLDLWEKLDALVARHQVTFEWVEGHAGNPLNEEADQLARRAAMLVAKSGRPQRQRPTGSGALSLVEMAQTATDGSTRTLTSTPGSRVSLRKRAASPDTLSDGEVATALAPLLDRDEAVMRCAACGRAFVDRSTAHEPHYCSLAACQLEARRRRRSG